MKVLQLINTNTLNLEASARMKAAASYLSPDILLVLKRSFLRVINACLLLVGLVFANLFFTNLVQAHTGHDHGNEQADLPPLIQPRMVVSSEQIELVGILNGAILTFYLDNYATNEPLVDVIILVEGPEGEQQAEAQDDGTFILDVDWLTSPGSYELLLTINADNWDDLLTATLVIPEPRVDIIKQRTVPSLWIIVLALLLLIAVAMFLLMVKRKRNASAIVMGLLVSLTSAMPTDSWAHIGHDHAKTAPLPTDVSRPMRLPDGSLFVPKPAQRLLTIRTLVAQQQSLPISLQLNGHVIPDPSFSGLVQSAQAARIEPDKVEFPYVGQKVTVNQLLTYVIPIADSLELGNQRAQLAELSAELKLAEKALLRLQQLSGSVSKKELEAAISHLESLKGRKTAVANSLFKRQAIFAPVSGVISQVEVRVGQVIAANDTLFEIIDPTRLWVNALAYDVSLANQAVSATAQTLHGDMLSLTLRGVGMRLQGHAVPVYFQISAPFPPLSVEQPLKVWLETDRRMVGIPVPIDSIRKISGSAHVWLHIAAERFESRQVEIQPFDAYRVVIVDGVKADERVVTVGAGTLDQIR